ncbi:MAG: glycine cleavage system aminomethyltransferase GcvT [Planctomycetes bacterium]|nr:glycine cleavage system aminomethyltransferase GcvT [Planctomycetota bacterium]
MKKTPLEAVHLALGARMVPFGGWSMPVQYAGILEEARAVRERAGLFDLGHMGRVHVSGGDAEAFLQRLQTNNAAAIPAGKIRYAMILDAEGRTQDDILVYREPASPGFFVVVNAGNTDRDLGIMRSLAAGFRDLRLVDQTADLAMIAIQGPAAERIARSVTDIDLPAIKYYSWARGKVMGAPGAMSRTGYTGEDGFEMYVPNAVAVPLWNKLMELGEKAGLVPCGLGSRDILRLEAGMPLYGHEIDESTTPLDAGLEFGVKFDHDFVGRAALERVKAAGGPSRKLVGLVTESRRVPRQGYDVVHGGRVVGKVCSGGASPTLGKHIATAYVPRELAEPGTALEFAIKDKTEAATVAPLPFYKRGR